MTVGPFPVSTAIARLRTHAPALLAVGSAADLTTALAQQPRVAISAYVTAAEVGRAIKYTGPLAIQNCDVTLRVVLFVRHYGDEQTGGGARSEMDEEVIPQVRAALFGWAPADAFDALSFQAGRDESYTAGWLVSQQVFGTNYRMSHQVTP
ncbi:hypothetical protein RM61_15150 [Xanthomonas phaseoli pv. phaseoli]|uniref:phage tail terminator protein n=1 Tax=Xanthomonas phaseoli TaxID=1985254 RepID=UPI00057385BB|nr:hypothetical protein [Xanthomonas phaseoli]KHS06600.1 hypothetical protein RM61_15150 [Xanthomonas phaseoli pv. phaseoli]